MLAYNDLIAMGVLQQLRKRGIRVPDEMSVVGFDDIPAATLVEPALTSIALPLNQVGREAIELLISGSDQTQRSLPVDLVVRSSTAPARHAARAAATTIVGSAR